MIPMFPEILLIKYWNKYHHHQRHRLCHRHHLHRLSFHHQGHRSSSSQIHVIHIVTLIHNSIARVIIITKNTFVIIINIIKTTLVITIFVITMIIIKIHLIWPRYRPVSPNNSLPWSTMRTIFPNLTSIAIHHLSQDTTYEFVVFSRNNLGEGLCSDVIQVRTRRTNVEEACSTECPSSESTC